MAWLPCSRVESGPTVLFRAELDALPITEAWRRLAVRDRGEGHLCGHDGHMAMLLGFGRLLARRPVRRGRVVLMFQPAEKMAGRPRRGCRSAPPPYAGLGLCHP